MEFLNNITESVGGIEDLGAMAEGLNPAEELTAQAEELTGGIADTATQATEGISDSIGGLFN